MEVWDELRHCSYASDHLGEQLREDGFLNDAAGSDAVAVTEAVLRAVEQEPEEAKIEFIGRLYAAIAFRPDVGPREAQAVVAATRRASWSQVLLMAAMLRHDGPIRLSDEFETVAVGEVLSAVGIGLAQTSTSTDANFKSWQAKNLPASRSYTSPGRPPVDSYTLSDLGRLSAELMGLHAGIDPEALQKAWPCIIIDSTP